MYLLLVRYWHKAAEIRVEFLAIAMTASKAIAVIAESEDIASNSCYKNLMMNLPMFCWSVSRPSGE